MSSFRREDDDVWPSLLYLEWKPTLTTLHTWTQVVGKVKLELTPLLNDWWNVTFFVTARGLTTAIISFGQRVLQVDFDFIDHRLTIQVSDGRSRAMPLTSRAVADSWMMATYAGSLIVSDERQMRRVLANDVDRIFSWIFSRADAAPTFDVS